MIGLGSNRLSVCRRGGMVVTQAGRGGMEWLAGGRLPSWTSPYSAQATAALKAQFPTQWPTIRDYGFAHPEIVPYVNANPLCAAIWCCYVQDGLVFQMDCNYECTAAKWKDVRSAIEFIGTNVQLTDGVPSFNSSYYRAGSALVFGTQTHTLEIVYNPTANSGHLFSNGSGSLGASFYTNGMIMSYNGGYMAQPPFSTNGLLSALSFNKERMYRNRALLTSVGQQYWGGVGNKSEIGARNGGDFFNGKIYAIRIYNRLLTEQEILANQAIDLQRWQPS